MKITGIEIGDYRQFKNIKFDFTYPAGHPKEGQPLDKVCFIGQSGTGKTTLLNAIWDFLNTIIQASTSVFNTTSFNNLIDNSFLPEVIEASIFSMSIDGRSVDLNRERSIEKSDKDFLSSWFLENLSTTQQYKIDDTNKIGIYIKDSIAREADAFLVVQNSEFETFSDFVKTDNQVINEKTKKEELIRAMGRKKTTSLGDLDSLSAWEYLLQDISQYDETGRELVNNIVLNREKFTADQLIQRLTYWRDNTINPRLDLAENCLNPLLKHFFLEVDTNGSEVLIVVKTLKGVKIDSSYLSTGTRQLLATAIPIYKFDTIDTVVLFDEPERSLFPDIQRILIDYYTSLAPKAQFFFATHSPIIASAFEPCERFILYFDKNGEVKFHNGVAPEGDDPNDILRQDFDMAELMLQKGLEAYEEYRRLAMQIRSETDEAKKNQLIAERLELGNRYNFAGQYAQSR